MKEKTRWLLAFAAIAVIASGIFIARQRTAGTVRLSGRVVDPGGSPLSGVRVILEVSPNGSEEAAVERVETQSDAQGKFSIAFQGHWRHASYRLEARKAGFEDSSVGDAETLTSPVTLRLARAR